MAKSKDETLKRLVQKAQAGDRDAFSTIVRQLMKPVTALTYRMTGEKESALDLAQDTFVSAWQNLAGFRGESEFKSWLYRIAANKSLNFLKSENRRRDQTRLEPALSDSSPDNPEKVLLDRELAGSIRSFMGSLPEQQRLIFNLRFYHEMPFAEIADLTGRALGTVKTGYREAVAKLRTYARDNGWRS